MFGPLSFHCFWQNILNGEPISRLDIITGMDGGVGVEGGGTV